MPVISGETGKFVAMEFAEEGSRKELFSAIHMMIRGTANLI